ncbi:nitroreductase [Streptomyces sp. NPDC047097]|uniref:Acg family FMN-binding oxidoreductase n=1 Tax=Streptomyces sp. NPDC047097 TaxID=3155260 RepID=UPI0033F9E9B9
MPAHAAPETNPVTSWVADAVMAPSMHNAQPWTFRYRPADGVLLLSADPARALPHSDPSGRGTHLGCGAALFTLRVAAAHAGWEASARLLPDAAAPGTLAAVTFTRSGAAGDGTAELYPGIARRRTSRQPFRDEAVPAPVLEGLRAAARREGAQLDVADQQRLNDLAELQWDAEHAERDAPRLRAELARWTAGQEQEATEGIPAGALGPRARDGRSAVRDFAPGGDDGVRETAVFERTPCLAVLGTREDTPADWLRAGQALQRVLLRATLDGLSTSLNSQALEWPELRWMARDPRSPAGYPQILLRLGYGPQSPATPRRPVSEVLDIV